MNISNVSFSSAKKIKNNNIIKIDRNQVKVSIPSNYKIVIKPDKEKLVMKPEVQEDIFVPSQNDEAENTTKSEESQKLNKVKEDTEQTKEQKTSKQAKGNNENSAIEKAKKITRIVVTVIMTALSALGLKEGKDILEYVPDVSSAVVNFDPENQNLSDVAETYNIDENVIKQTNGIYSDNDLSNAKSITIPIEYDYIDDAIDDKTQALYKAKPYSAEHDNLSKELNALKKKQKEQEELGDIYSDGETVYIFLNDEDDNPELAKKFKGNIVPVDYLEKLFDINDDELYKYNTIVGDDNTQGICLGSVIKVPVSAINKDNINLSGYLK
jgi:hypothetical protein